MTRHRTWVQYFRATGRCRYAGLLAILLVGCGAKPQTATEPRDVAQLPDGVLLERDGELASGDLVLGGALSDHYEVAVEAGTRLTIEVTTDAFDPVLEVIPPGGGPIANDDYMGARDRSRIDLAVAHDGVLKVRVTSYGQGAAGAYRLAVRQAGVAGANPGLPGAQLSAVLGAGQEIEGELGGSDATLRDGAFFDQLLVDVAAGEPITLEVVATAGAPRVSVVAPNGQELAAPPGGGLRLDQVGVHRVLIAGSAAGEQVRYRARAVALGGVSPAAAPSLSRAHHRPRADMPTAGGLALGQRLSGALEAADATLDSGELADAYLLEGRAGSRVSFEMNSTVIDTYLLVVGPNGALWENDDSAGATNSGLTFELPRDGNYRVIATSYRAGETGSYELKAYEESRALTGSGPVVAPTPTVAPPVPATPGTAPPVAGQTATHTGRLEAGDAQLSSGELSDSYTFMFRAGQRVSLALSSTEFDPYLIVRSPSGRQRDNDDMAEGNLNSALDYDVTESGPHTVLVTSYRSGESGAYQLDLRGAGAAVAGTTAPSTAPNPTPASPTAASPAVAGEWQTHRGALARGDATLPSGEWVDSFQFDWQPGQPVRLDLRSTQFDSYLIVRTPSGRQEQNDDREPGNVNAALDLVVTEAGRYTVMVTSYQPGEEGEYSLLVRGGTGAAVATTNGPQPTTPVVVTGSNRPTTPAAPVAATAREVRVGETIRGALATGDQQLPSGELTDTHLLRLPAGSPLRLHLTSTRFDPYLIVRTPAGQQIDNDDIEPGNLSAGIDLPAVETGAYTVIVTSYSAGESGDYQLLVEGLGAVVRPTTPSAPGRPGAPPPGDGQAGRVFGLFAGITDYPAGVGDLAECANDAVKLAETMRQQGLLTEDRQVVLTDAQATTGNIRQAMGRFAGQVGPSDIFIFFYSGHGGRTRGGSQDPREIDQADEYLYAYDGQLMDDEMATLFDGLHARIAVLALDSCFAGGFAKDVITRPGRIGLFSSEEDVTSAVASAFQAGGYLSHFLRTGMSGEADLAPRDNVLTVGELTHYLSNQFGTHVRDVRMSEGYQQLVVDRGAVGTQQILWAYR